MPEDAVANADDCDDSTDAISPDAEEVCDNMLDDNCDGMVDEDCATGSSSGGDESGGQTTSGDTSGDTDTDGGALDDDDDDGCSCTTSDRGQGLAWMLFGLFGLSAMRRRRG